MTKLHLCATGGTLAMGYVSDDFLKEIDFTTHKDVKKGNYLYPLYDIRHFILAAQICTTVTDNEKRTGLLQKLVQTKDLITQRLCAEQRNEGNDCHKKALDDALEAIAKEAQLGTVNTILQEYGIAEANNSQPYYIDSTDFSLTGHYPKLLGTAGAFFSNVSATGQHSKVMMVIGGTDTEEIYANLLAKDLMRHGYITKDHVHSLLFLSSMASFEDNPERIGNYFRAALSLAVNTSKGAYALMAENENASEVVVMEATGMWAKVFPKEVQAFRGMELGRMKKEENYACNCISDFPESSFISPAPDIGVRQCIAPPLMAMNDVPATIQFLQAILNDKDTPFQGIILEGIHGLLTGGKEIVGCVRQLVARGIAVYCVNEHSYDQEQKVFAPKIPETHWNTSEQLKELQKAGAVVVNKNTTYGCYVDAVLGAAPLPAQEKTVRTTKQQPEKKCPAIALRYIPDPVAFEAALEIAATIAENIIISALPENAIPKHHAETIAKLSGNGSTFHIAFRYNDPQYTQGIPSGSNSQVKEENAYAAHTLSVENVKAYHCAPEEILSKLLDTNKIRS